MDELEVFLSKKRLAKDGLEDVPIPKRQCPALPLEAPTPSSSPVSFPIELDYVVRPHDGWTIETFPKPTSGIVLLIYEDSALDKQFAIPVDRISDDVWEVLICLDGERISEREYNCSNEKDDDFPLDEATLALWGKIKSSGLVHPGRYERTKYKAPSFDCFSEFEIPTLARLSNISEVSAIIHVNFFYVQQF